jgi:hypothetical protein
LILNFSEFCIVEHHPGIFISVYVNELLSLASSVCAYDKDETRVEAGSNTSTVTLRVVRGDEMGLKKAAP